MSDADGFYQNAGARVDALTSHLECRYCGARHDYTTGSGSNFLRTGWPKCCGYTMTLVTHRQVKERAAK